MYAQQWPMISFHKLWKPQITTKTKGLPRQAEWQRMTQFKTNASKAKENGAKGRSKANGEVWPNNMQSQRKGFQRVSFFMKNRPID